MARAPPSQRLAAVPEDDDKTLQWGLVDFLGKYHKHAIASDFPVPGSAVSRDELREAQYKAHIEGIRDRVNNIQARKGESVQEKVRHETFALKALIQMRVGSTLDRVGATLEEIDREVEAFDAEQGRSRVAKYIEEAVIEPPQPPPGDGEFDEDGELAGTDPASRRVEAPSLPQYDSSPGMMEVGGFFSDFGPSLETATRRAGCTTSSTRLPLGVESCDRRPWRSSRTPSSTSRRRCPF